MTGNCFNVQLKVFNKFPKKTFCLPYYLLLRYFTTLKEINWRELIVQQLPFVLLKTTPPPPNSLLPSGKLTMFLPNVVLLFYM